MLLGQYESKIGDKHQVGLPKKIRDSLGERLIITKGFEKCLIIVSENNWKTLLEGTEGKPFTSKAAREMQRFLLGNASFVDLDQKGRFVVPEYLRNFAHIDTEIVFVGVSRFVELWDKKSWEDHQMELSSKIETIAEKLSEEKND
jgi:MraZ protein